MLKFITGKILHLLLVYFLASGALFLSMKAIPGDPVMLKFTKHPDPEQVAVMREALYLDKPWTFQFWHFQKKFLSGDWERSLLSGRLALEDVAEYFPPTLELSVFAMLLGVFVGASAALYARVSESRFSKTVAMSFGALGLTVPIFWIGLLSLVLGSLVLGIFPLGNRFDFAEIPPDRVTGFLVIDSLLAGNFGALGTAVNHLFLPVCCLSVIPAANVSSILYARLNEPATNALYVALKARGFGPLRIVFLHLLRVAGSPIVTIVGTTFGVLLGGAFLTETVFSWPGIGRYLVTAIIDRDLFVAQYVLLMLIMLVFAMAFLSDVLARWLDVVAEDGKGGSE